MKQNVIVGLLLFSLLLNAVFLIQSYRQNIVVSVPDGDSLQLRDGRRIRLLGIDAPERGRCMAEEARNTLSDAANNRHIRMKHVVTDDFGRQLGDVIIDDVKSWTGYIAQKVIPANAGIQSIIRWIPGQAGDDKMNDPYLNRLMVSRGLARYSGSTKSEYYDTLKSTQTTAKDHKLGIWSETCRSEENPDCSIKGNIRAGKKTYLVPGCKNYTQTIIDTSFGDTWFCTEEEATKAGFSKASACSK